MPEDVQFGVQFIPDLDDLQNDIDSANLTAEVDTETGGMPGGGGGGGAAAAGAKAGGIAAILIGILKQAESIQALLDLVFAIVNASVLVTLKAIQAVLKGFSVFMRDWVPAIVDGIDRIIASIETMINTIGRALAAFANSIPGVRNVSAPTVSLPRFNPSPGGGGGTGTQQTNVNINVEDSGLSTGAERQRKANTIAETFIDEAAGAVGDLFNG